MKHPLFNSDQLDILKDIFNDHQIDTLKKLSISDKSNDYNADMDNEDILIKSYVNHLIDKLI
jgi:hypothetical protein